MKEGKSKARGPAFMQARRFFLFCCAVGTAAGTTIAPPEFDALVNGSDYIVHAITRSVSAEKRNSTHGVRIITRVELEVTEVVAGTPPGKVVLEMLGGRVGNEELRVAGAPRFLVGDEDILFVSGNGRAISPLYGMTYGRYPVKRDPASGRGQVLRSDGEPLRDPAQISAPLGESHASSGPAAQAVSGLSPAEFIRQIKAARAAGASANREK